MVGRMTYETWTPDPDSKASRHAQAEQSIAEKRALFAAAQAAASEAQETGENTPVVTPQD